jgi:hypothetical protein
MRTTLPLTGLLTMAFAATLNAQEPERQETAVGTRLRDFGGFVELDTRFGDMMGEFAAFAGARGAVRLKQRVYLGLGGAGLATDNAGIPGPIPGSIQPLRMGYGGILVGYVVPTRSLVDVTADVLVGAGGVSIKGTDSEDAIFVFEPTVGVDLRLARVARLGIGAGYRFVGDVDLAGIEDSDLRGFTGTVAIRVGWF